jgi:hypothetical protein
VILKDGIKEVFDIPLHIMYNGIENKNY